MEPLILQIFSIFLFISGAEIFFLVFIIVMLFGSDKIPEIAKNLSKGMRQIKDVKADIKREIQNSGNLKDFDDSIVKDLTKEIDDIKETISK